MPMDKPTGEDNFITIDELREHWDVSEKTIRRHIRWRLSPDDRESFVRKMPLGQSMKGQDGEEHFFYTLERDFWMKRMEKSYPRKRKLHPLDRSTVTGTDTPPDSQRPKSGPLSGQADAEGSISQDEHMKQMKEWKGLYYHEREERKQERAERQALIRDNMRLNKMLLDDGSSPERLTESPLERDQPRASAPPQAENTPQRTRESHGQQPD